MLLSGLDGSVKGGANILSGPKAAQSPSSFARVLGQQADQIDADLEQWLATSGLDAHALLEALHAAGLNPKTLLNEWQATSSAGKDLNLFLKEKGFDTAALRKLNGLMSPLATTPSMSPDGNASASAATQQDALAFIQNTLFIAQESFQLRTANGASDALASKSLTKPNANTHLIASHNNAKNGLMALTDQAKQPLNPNTLSARLPIDTDLITPVGMQDFARASSFHTGTEFHLQLANATGSSSATQSAFGSASTYSAQIATPLTHAQWSQDLGRVMVTLTQHAQHTGPQNAEIRLDPPELGPLRIVLSITDNIANATIYAAHAQTRLTVEQALPQLQQQLANSGLSLGEASVSDHGLGSQAQHEPSSENHASSHTFSLATDTTTTDAGLASDVQSSTQRVASDAIIDTFA